MYYYLRTLLTKYKSTDIYEQKKSRNLYTQTDLTTHTLPMFLIIWCVLLFDLLELL